LAYKFEEIQWSVIFRLDGTCPAGSQEAVWLAGILREMSFVWSTKLFCSRLCKVLVFFLEVDINPVVC